MQEIPDAELSVEIVRVLLEVAIEFPHEGQAASELHFIEIRVISNPRAWLTSIERGLRIPMSGNCRPPCLTIRVQLAVHRPSRVNRSTAITDSRTCADTRIGAEHLSLVRVSLPDEAVHVHLALAAIS